MVLQHPGDRSPEKYESKYQQQIKRITLLITE